MKLLAIAAFFSLMLIGAPAAYANSHCPGGSCPITACGNPQCTCGDNCQCNDEFYCGDN